MKVAYFDCFSGAGGDMIVASLLDAGADAGGLRAALETLGVGGYTLAIEKINKQGFAATRFNVQLQDSHGRPHRHLADIVKIIDASALESAVKRDSKQIFARLAQAEAAVHGTTVESVHFHEVGAVDAILDVVGAVVCVHLLGIERVVCSPIPTGSGTIRCDHGTMPIPAPATAELLKGIPIAASGEVGELTTPTGAAVLTTLADEFGLSPAMVTGAIGYGAGTRDGKGLPNLLRVLVGETASDGDRDEVIMLEANLDDVSPEVTAYCLERLLEGGALDAYAVPIQMKKSRCGVLLAALCEPECVDKLERIIFAETTTFGIRRYSVSRSKLSRRHESVETPFGMLRMKIGERDGVVTASPEYEDCKSAAGKYGVSLREVMAAAQRAWAESSTR